MQEKDPLPACVFCENAIVTGRNNEHVECSKNFPLNPVKPCPFYAYDLTKRKPVRIRVGTRDNEES